MHWFCFFFYSIFLFVLPLLLLSFTRFDIATAGCCCCCWRHSLLPTVSPTSSCTVLLPSLSWHMGQICPTYHGTLQNKDKQTTSSGTSGWEDKVCIGAELCLCLPGSSCSRPCCWQCILGWAHRWRPRGAPHPQIENPLCLRLSQASQGYLDLTQTHFSSPVFAFYPFVSRNLGNHSPFRTGSCL